MGKQGDNNVGGSETLFYLWFNITFDISKNLNTVMNILDLMGIFSLHDKVRKKIQILIKV